MAKRKSTIAIVEWYDAYSSPECQKQKGDRGIPTISVGHLVERTKYGIRLAIIGHVRYDNKLEHRDEHFIPKGMIHKVTIRRI